MEDGGEGRLRRRLEDAQDQDAQDQDAQDQNAQGQQGYSVAKVIRNCGSVFQAYGIDLSNVYTPGVAPRCQVGAFAFTSTEAPESRRAAFPLSSATLCQTSLEWVGRLRDDKRVVDAAPRRRCTHGERRRTSGQ